MKKQLFLALTAAVVVLFAACTNESENYKRLLEAEKDAISGYISRNDIKVIQKAPANNVWNENEYLRTASGVYIHIADTGSKTSATIIPGQTVGVRYYKITLDAEPDTVVRYWTVTDSPDAREFIYGVSDAAIPNGFHEAIQYMRRDSSEATLIIPSKQGDKVDQYDVLPFAYRLKISYFE
ncbi:MAG: DUF4827 domain-containing protein [Prevotellaceae bacterium]|jgi:hypothetical protein|nr:DUF4827 domain-containing protein [Prevotellaceae bacterium]